MNDHIKGLLPNNVAVDGAIATAGHYPNGRLNEVVYLYNRILPVIGVSDKAPD